MDLQVGILDVQRYGQPFALDGVRKRRGNVEVQCVAELIGLRRSTGFDTGREIARVVASETRLAERPEQVAQRLEAEEIETLVGDLEPGLLRFALLSSG